MKPASEADMSEIYPVVSEARHAMRNLHRWMRPRRVATPLALFGSRSRIVHEAKGVVLIISPTVASASAFRKAGQGER